MKKQQENQQQPILFYGKDNPQYQFLSNFYKSPFRVGQHIYQTNQHFFQSKKFQGTPNQIQVINCTEPKKAKALGKKLKMIRPENWADIKQNVMLLGLRAKFQQNPKLLQKLLQTNNRQLRQHTGRDKYWGDGGVKNTGKNRLGVLLMQVRQEFKKKQKTMNNKVQQKEQKNKISSLQVQKKQNKSKSKHKAKNQE